jgi:hypothetical protein
MQAVKSGQSTAGPGRTGLRIACRLAAVRIDIGRTGTVITAAIPLP